MSELVEFIRGCLDADEQTARAATGGPWFSRGQGDVARDATDMTIARCGVTHGAFEDATHIARHDPARVLAEVNAKRAILDECAEASADHAMVGGEFCASAAERKLHDATDPGEMILRLLAQPFRGEPGWRDEWGTQ